MCGIVGFTGSDEPPLLRAMTDALRHRGPDGEGYASAPAGRSAVVHFGHRRLVVLDREGGGQPFRTPDGRWLITYNGEVYNHPELREALRREDVRFTTRSDTEVLLQALARWGEAALPRLDGMFAFAAFDARERRLLLAVDRFGQKPLLWTVLPDGRLLFGSELHALRHHPLLETEWDPLAVVRMLAFNAPPAPHTILAGVHRLEPGTGLRVSLAGDGSVTAREVFRWWRPCFHQPAPAEALSPGRFEAALEMSVRRHLVADVPVGVLLSGGIDSTAVAMLAARNGPVRTVSVGFGESDYDESEEARRTAEALGTEHHAFRLSAREAADTLHRVIAHLDEPVADAGCLPAWHVYRHARSLVTVAVGGDGGDELLEGYPTFRAMEWAGRMPVPLARLMAGVLGPLARAVPVSEGYYPAGYQARRFVAGLAAEPWYRLQAYMGGCSARLLRRLLRPEVCRAAGLDARGKEFERHLYAPACPPAERTAAAAELAVGAHLRSFLAGEVLRKVDCMSMAHGLEVRAPMLGSPFAELCLSAPSGVRRRGGTGKLPLRAWLAGAGFPEVARRGKRGFAIPVARWLRSDLREAAEETFRGPRSSLRDWCQPPELASLWQGHLSGRQDARKELWALLTLGLWLGEHRMTRRAAASAQPAAARA